MQNYVCILKIDLKHQATVSMPLNCYLMLKAATFFSLKHEPWATLNIHFFSCILNDLAVMTG